MLSRFFIAIIAFFAINLSARAADIEWIVLDIDQMDAVSLNGALAEGDLQKLRDTVDRRHWKEHLLVMFHSDGGDIREAIKIGQYIRDNEFTTAINDESICYSACFFSFIGGKLRLIKPTGKLGVHSFYDKQGDSNTSLEKYTESMGISPETIQIAARTSPQSLYVFNQSELENFSLISIASKQETNHADEVSPPAATQPAENIFWQQDGWTAHRGGNYCALYKLSSSTIEGMIWFHAMKGRHLFNLSYVNKPETLAKFIKGDENMVKMGDENWIKIILTLDDEYSNFLLANYVKDDEMVENPVSSFDMNLKKEDMDLISHHKMMSIFTQEMLIDIINLEGASEAFQALDKCHTLL